MERFFYLLFNCVIPIPIMFLIGWTGTIMALFLITSLITGEPEVIGDSKRIVRRMAWLSIPGGLWIALQESARNCF